MRTPFTHRLRVRYGECDPQGVVFNAHYLSYADVAMTELWRARVAGGYEQMVAAGIDMVVAEATVRFRAPARFDDELSLEPRVTRLGTTAMSTTVRVLHGDELVAEVDLRHVFVATDGSGKVAMPSAVHAGLSPHLAPGAGRAAAAESTT